MAKTIIKDFKSLCTPASLYFVISMIMLVLMIIQNLGNKNIYCVGKYYCPVNNTAGIFVLKTLFILFFTWVLNVFCKAGYTNFAWFMILIPYILFFIMIGTLMYSSS